MALRLDEWRLKMSDAVTGPLDKISGAADRTAARFMRAQDRISRIGDSIKRGFTGVGDVLKGAGSELRDELTQALPLPPQLSRGLAALAGPIGIAVAAAGALTLGLAKGVQAAEAYGVPFRYLRNLNLDKTQEELDQVNRRVLKLSFSKGLDPTTVMAGVADVQSTIGAFGPEVEQMVARIGEASRALDMDFGTAVSGISKALVQFRMPLTDVDKLMASNAKTVNLGVVSYDELSKVQTEYAGAAASANQTVDTANKLFTLLTTNTKNADIAATMAKASFQDLGKKDTVDALKKIGVNIFDANGAMRQADQVLRELVPKFAQMSDRTFATLKEEIGGSEGLRGLLDMAKASGTEVLRVLDGFDQANVSVNDAIERAKNDLDVVKAKLSGQVQAALVKLGQVALPLVVSFNQGLSAAIENLTSVVRWLRGMYQESMIVRTAVEGVFAMLKTGWEAVVFAFKQGLTIIITPIKAIGEALQGNFGAAWETLKSGVGDLFGNVADLASNVGAAWKQAYNDIGAQQKPINVPVKFLKMDEAVPQPAQMPLLSTALQPVGLGPIKTAASTAQEKVAQAAGPQADPYAGVFGKKGKADKAISQGVSEVVGGGKQVRNINVRIEALVKELVVQTTNMREGTGDIKRAVEETLIRAVQGAELAIAAD
ncbi:MAG TPA: phage tail tape measure protein [Flavobacteriales bacterium]|nr:phage tail tape measure protein [Flavobacteriales bacterium]HMR28561.1 phage tail tape measure protein [Flavobacteriales bacterium]